MEQAQKGQALMMEMVENQKKQNDFLREQMMANMEQMSKMVDNVSNKFGAEGKGAEMKNMDKKLDTYIGKFKGEQDGYEMFAWKAKAGFRSVDPKFQLPIIETDTMEDTLSLDELETKHSIKDGFRVKK